MPDSLDLRPIAALARTLAARRRNGHRPPIVVLAQDVWEGHEAESSDVDMVAATREYWDRAPSPGMSSSQN